MSLSFQVVRFDLFPNKYIYSVADERAILVRDLRSGSYCLWTYFMAQQLIEIPSQILMASITLLIVFWMVGLQSFMTYVTYESLVGFCVVVLVLSSGRVSI